MPIAPVTRHARLSDSACQRSETAPLRHEASSPATTTRTGNQAHLRRLTAAGLPLQAKLMMGSVNDPLEQEADAAAERVMRIADPKITNAVPPTLSRKCEHCEEAEKNLQRDAAGAGAKGQVAPPIVDAVLASPGRTLDPATQNFMSTRFGTDFSDVRVHTDAQAAQSAAAVNARAYTVGHDVVFGTGQYDPARNAGRHLIAHELTHVLQQLGVSPRAKFQPASVAPQTMQRQCADYERHDWKGGLPAGPEQEDELVPLGGERTNETIPDLRTGGLRLQRDLAVEPSNPGAPTPQLTEPQIQEAIQFNEFRFKDPFSIATIRDVVGISRYPAVSDRELALAIAYWQAQFRLDADGKIGPATTATLIRELRAERLLQLVNQVRSDNSISVSAVGLTRTVPGPAVSGLFRLNVVFSTSLRNGWIVQVLNNTWNETLCGGTAIPTPPTPNYSEAWWVDGAGNVRRPTSVTQPPTHVATPPLLHDRWQRPARRGTRGQFTMTARLFTTLRLPAGFGVGTVADAGNLPSRVGTPNLDDLGLVVAQRTATGRWNGCAGVVNFNTP